MAAASSSGGPGKELTETIALPPVVEQVLERPGSTWTILQVDRKLNWKDLLAKALLKLPLDGPPELTKTGAQQVAVKLVEDPWGQFVPLHPADTEGKLVATATKVRRVVRVTTAAENRNEVDEHVRETEETALTAERRRQAGASKQKQLMMEQRRKALERFGVPPLTAALNQVGFSFDGDVDVQEDAEVDTSLQEPAAPVLHLRQLPEEEVKGGRMPLAFWNLGPMLRSRSSQLSFQCVRDAKKSAKHARLVGKMKGSKFQELVGTRLKNRGGTGFVTLLGVQTKDSKRIFFQEAEVFNVGTKKQPTVKSEEEPKMGYGAMKGSLVQDMGALKKQRQSRLIAARVNREVKVTTFGSYQEEAKQHAQELAAAKQSIEERDAEAKAKVLPPFDINATEPRGVYREGLNTLAPEEAMRREAALEKPELMTFLELPPAEQARAIAAFLAKPVLAKSRKRKFNDEEREDEEEEEETVGGLTSHFTLMVLALRARENLHPQDASERRALARQVCVLDCFATIVKEGGRFRRGKTICEGLAQLLGLPEESALVSRWHQDIYDPIIGKSKIRSFNGRKALCYMFIWALHLSPDLKLELKDATARDLGMQLLILKKGAEYVGCGTVDKKPPPGQGIEGKILEVKLDGPPRINRAYYEGKGSGRGKKKAKGGGR